MKHLIFLTLIVFTIFSFSLNCSANEKKWVSLILSKAVIEPDTIDDMIGIECHVIVKNETGKELQIKSSLYSVFDGLTIVVTDEKNNIITQVPYSYHQSTYSLEGRIYPLKQGETKSTLSFPFVLPKNTIISSLKIRLIGDLPGSTYTHLLSSNTMKPTKIAEQGASPNSLWRASSVQFHENYNL